MLTSKMIKDAALAAGADLCGIAPISRLKGAPKEMNPAYLFPEAKSVIALESPEVFREVLKKEHSSISILQSLTEVSTKFSLPTYSTR